MTNDPQRPFPDFLKDRPTTQKASAAELQARYHRIKRRQQILAIVGIVSLVLLYVFLRHMAPVIWGGHRRR